MCVYACITCACVYVSQGVHVVYNKVCVRMNTCIHVYIHTYVYVCIHVYMYTSKCIKVDDTG